MKKILSKMKSLERPHHFYGDFSRRSRAGNSAARFRILPNLELIRDFMVVLVTCKNEDVSIKNDGARVATRLYMLIFPDAQGQIIPYSEVGSCRNSNSSKLYTCPCYLQE